MRLITPTFRGLLHNGALGLLQKRLKEDENLALEYTATDLFEGTSIDKRQAWLNMPDSERAQYDKQAEGKHSQPSANASQHDSTMQQASKVQSRHPAFLAANAWL